MAYATISLFVSLGLGVVIYRTSVRYERATQVRGLSTAAQNYAQQMDDRLGRMDAIVYYVLSDPSALEGITLLRRSPVQEIPFAYKLEAEKAIQTTLSTEYIIQNSYRTVFFNQNGRFFSSAFILRPAMEDASRRLRESFSLMDIPYLDEVEEANGKSILIGPHEDFWGAEQGSLVYSVMKQVRGEGMGFLEVENRVDSLGELKGSDPDLEYLILLREGRVLFCSDPSQEERMRLAYLSRDSFSFTKDGYLYAYADAESFGVTVLASKGEAALAGGRQRILLATFLPTMAVFIISLAFIIIWSFQLTVPMVRLRKIVEKTDIENLAESGRIQGVVSGPDEFTELAHAYEAMTRRLDLAIQNTRRAELLQLQAQIDVLQTQVNPHFLYNVLNIISARAVIADDEVICEMCGSLGAMLRYSTNNKERYALVEDELVYLESYFYLLKCRYESRLAYSVDIEEDVKKMTLPKMTLQQIVENAVKHGFHDTGMDMKISIRGRMEEDGWRITIWDNGCQVSEEASAALAEKLQVIRKNYLGGTFQTEGEIGGMGLPLVYARCILLYDTRFFFDIHNEEGGKGVSVTIGVRQNP